VNALRARGCLAPTRMRRDDGGNDGCSDCARARAAGRAAAVWASELALVALSTGATADPRA